MTLRHTLRPPACLITSISRAPFSLPTARFTLVNGKAFTVHQHTTHHIRIVVTVLQQRKQTHGTIRCFVYDKCVAGCRCAKSHPRNNRLLTLVSYISTAPLS